MSTVVVDLASLAGLVIISVVAIVVSELSGRRSGTCGAPGVTERLSGTARPLTAPPHGTVNEDVWYYAAEARARVREDEQRWPHLIRPAWKYAGTDVSATAVDAPSV
jgi:hypothetical protein